MTLGTGAFAAPDEFDQFDLRRFVEAQLETYDQALMEIRSGAKRSHWMWYTFPQIAGLGTSAMARRFAISSLEEARAYLRHPVLGARLHECVTTLHGLAGLTAEQVFGAIDAVKLRSSLTLFDSAGTMPICQAVLVHWFAGPDEATLRILAAERPGAWPAPPTPDDASA